jgi:hypothetical protein
MGVAPDQNNSMFRALLKRVDQTRAMLAQRPGPEGNQGDTP